MPDDEAKKKISVILNMDLIRQIEDHKMTQTEAVTKGLEILFSEDYKHMKYYQKQIQEDKEKILVLGAKLSEFDNYKKELRCAHDQFNEMMRQHEMYLLQLQDVIKQRENEVRLKEDTIRQKEDRILLLEDKKQIAEQKKPFWKFW